MYHCFLLLSSDMGQSILVGKGPVQEVKHYTALKYPSGLVFNIRTDISQPEIRC